MNLDGVSPIRAVGYLLRGLQQSLTNPAIRRPLLAGMLVNTLVFIVFLALPVWGIILGVRALREWTAADTGFGPLDWLLDLVFGSSLPWLEGILIAGFLFMTPVVFALASSIIGPIFRAKLWNAARNANGGPEVSGKPNGIVVEARLVGVEIRRLLRFLFFSVLLLFLNLVPGVGSAVYLAAQFILAAHTMGWDLLSYHFELHDVRYGDQKRVLRRHRPLVLTLGAAATLLTMVPVAQLLFVQTNAAGAGIVSAKLDGVST